MNKQAELTSVMIKVDQFKRFRQDTLIEANSCLNGQYWAKLIKCAEKLINSDFLIAQAYDRIRVLKQAIEDESKDIL